MKKKVFIALLCLIALEGIAQKISVEDIVVGKHLSTGKIIYGKKYNFGEDFNMLHFDSVNQTFTTHLRNTKKNKGYVKVGKLIQYDFKTHTFRWIKELKLQFSYVFDGCLFLNTHQKGWTRLDFNTGEPMWHTKDKLAFIDTTHKVAITCDIGNDMNFEDRIYTLTGLDLQTGQKKWSFPIRFPFGINFITDNSDLDRTMYLNDSTIIISESGFYAVNLKTGKGWHYKVETGQKQEKIKSTFNGMSTDAIALHFREGIRFCYPKDYDVVTGLCSGILKDSAAERLYFASKKHLACVDFQGQEVWKFPFPENVGSSSTLYFKDSLVYVVNYGSANFNMENINYGQPFVAAFSKTTGEQKFFLSFSKNETIASANFKSNGLTLLFKDKIATFSLQDGHLLEEANRTKKPLSEINYFSSTSLYVPIGDSLYDKVDIMDTTQHVMNGKDNTIIVLDTHFKLLKEIKGLNTYYSELSNCRFITKDKALLMLDKNNHPITRLTAYPQYKSKDLFYCLEFDNTNAMIEVKIEDILNPN
jgi:outer membrane protein assembly factor BamB